ncbi:AhpC/TSA family protein [Olivibacter sp. SDN3]|uniref:TlpA disulfide reductase family protein n=1 Tax=Olivibacter sp. SDN3 TaxID=2764720 RepID=UPI001650DBE1|nr:TlpA disulfide reductase family protein [Olivibacter sp. SDN3]QNL48924.1 AhpC/TSA family protein [Olivibacter sp. SDN3]
MKKIIFTVSIMIFFACSNDDQFVLDGELVNSGDVKKIFLYEGGNVVDSAFLDENNKFRFRRTAPMPQFYDLKIGNNHYFFVLSNGEKVGFKANLEDPDGKYDISGSEISSKIKAFSEINMHYANISKKIEGEFQMRLGAEPDKEKEIREELLNKYKTNLTEFSQDVLAFSQRNIDNLAGFYAISSLDPVEYEQEMMAYADSIKNKFPQNAAVRDFVTHMAELKPLSIGNRAPDFELMNEKGKNVKLSDFRGQYTLVDFWASWCVPCREENPNIVSQYNIFKDRNFTVLGVSLDNNQAAWVKAIKDDKLTWIHVSDLQAWNSKAAELYKVSSIPASFLLDPEGVIIAKNLRGIALAEFLQKTL